MTSKLYIIFFVKKMVSIQLYKVCWNKYIHSHVNLNPKKIQL